MPRCELTWAAKRALTCRSVRLTKGADRMTTVFSRTAHAAVARALAIVWAAAGLAPIALGHWF